MNIVGGDVVGLLHDRYLWGLCVYVLYDLYTIQNLRVLIPVEISGFVLAVSYHPLAVF